MVRAPCCEKIGLKKGPWSPEEDRALINYIKKNGHSNWRALPKQAGLLRCGKSCRLRWLNYLRPDVKRGNFTTEEEEIILKLHQTLGNRWAAIAARLPGRTDNEIKNFWHTHLKKRSLASYDVQNQQTKHGVDHGPASSEHSSSFMISIHENVFSHELVDESFWSSDEEIKSSNLIGCVGKDDGEMGFWYDLFFAAGGLEDMHEIN